MGDRGRLETEGDQRLRVTGDLERLERRDQGRPETKGDLRLRET